MSDPKTSERMGTVSLPGYAFLAHSAKMWHVVGGDENGEQAARQFRICTQAPYVSPSDEHGFLFSNGFGIDAEDGPIPLPEVDDLTGVEVEFESSYDLETGEPYFSFMAMEWGDISHVRLRFLERGRDRYRVEFTGRTERLFEVHHLA